VLGLHEDCVHPLHEVRTFSPGDDRDAIRRHQRSGVAAELETDRLLAADLLEPSPLQERSRRVVAFPRLELEAVLAEAPGQPRHFGEEGGADPGPAPVRHDGHVGGGEALGRALDETASDRLVGQPGDEEDQPSCGRVSGMPEVGDLRAGVGIDDLPDGDQRLEILVGLGRRDDELRQLGCVHWLSSSGEVVRA
jgi:hypothetical protein